MFIGGSLMNDYFASKINLFIALAPITRISHTMSSLMKLMAAHTDEL